jgi:hypothetical protein
MLHCEVAPASVTIQLLVEQELAGVKRQSGTVLGGDYCQVHHRSSNWRQGVSG